MNEHGRRTLLQTIVDEAATAVAAEQAWLVRMDGSVGSVVATSNTLTDRIGTAVSSDGVRGYAVASGQVAVLVPAASDSSAAGVAGWDGVPPSLLVAPASETGVVLELAGKRTGGGFTFDDIEAAVSYVNIAASAVAEDAGPTEVPSPTALGAGLAALAAADAIRYREVAALVETMLTAAR